MSLFFLQNIKINDLQDKAEVTSTPVPTSSEEPEKEDEDTEESEDTSDDSSSDDEGSYVYNGEEDEDYE